MKVLVTGSAGHLGEALVREQRALGHEVASLDRLAGAFTSHVGSITDRACVRRALAGVNVVFHAATLHKPHIITHSRQQFIDSNVSGTLVLLEEALAAGVGAFIYTSTTSVFGAALMPAAEQPAVWVTEELRPLPKNIYGVTKAAAEDLCQVFHREHPALACVVLRTSRFFPEQDDSEAIRSAYDPLNVKLNEFLFRRVDLADVAAAHQLAAQQAAARGFARYIISATTPFTRADVAQLRVDAPRVLCTRVPEFEAEYARRGWRMFPAIDRVYDNERARAELGWQPRWDFRYVLERLRRGAQPVSRLAAQVGAKGYHEQKFALGPYPVK
ncbi:MAG TPA: NAD(P)-dependent oxidoreductase [Candidatus Dormibacteraeota bacterium]|nr:NAD(P)-dependent oxidoreductase [Candidatus Dormibacteraeota bacterium]